MFLLDRLFWKIIRDGELTVVDAAGTIHVYGVPNADHPAVTVRFTDAAAARAVAINPALGAGEGFMDGRLIIEKGDILHLVDLVTWNLRWQRDNPIRFAFWRQASLAARFDQINFARRAKRNVAHHYDSMTGCMTCFSTRIANIAAPISMISISVSTRRRKPSWRISQRG